MEHLLNMAELKVKEIKTTEMHCAGGSLRIIETGFPKLMEPTVLGKRREVIKKYDTVRRYLLAEPRGHYGMYGILLCESELVDADFGVLFMHNEGTGVMCGHAVMAIARYAIDKGIVRRTNNSEGTLVNVHCPCGLVQTRVLPDNQVAFLSVPAFVAATDQCLRLSNGTTVYVDVVFAGTFYALLDMNQLHIDITCEPINSLIDIAEEAKMLVNREVKLSHPDSDELCYCAGTIVHDGKEGLQDSINLLVFAEKQVERSAGGSCVTARLALQYHKNNIELGQEKLFYNSKVPHSSLRGKVVEELEMVLPGHTKPIQAIKTEVRGKPYYTGTNIFTLENDDDLSNEGGFLIDARTMSTLKVTEAIGKRHG